MLCSTIYVNPKSRSLVEKMSANFTSSSRKGDTSFVLLPTSGSTTPKLLSKELLTLHRSNTSDLEDITVVRSALTSPPDLVCLDAKTGTDFLRTSSFIEQKFSSHPMDNR
ncbi:hypothetical protein Pmani_014833 [Petrolisthes manimaculis]|uniref:Uncharacterized protein n=1 Tax=Petrolisthes manimaculis TaxID=1843537 RepID=A0AAE1U8A6_9EUCA|nr:hypothetical protein Pmani_014833 [Petrolisthes manimaculis]